MPIVINIKLCVSISIEFIKNTSFEIAIMKWVKTSISYSMDMSWRELTIHNDYKHVSLFICHKYYTHDRSLDGAMIY